MSQRTEWETLNRFVHAIQDGEKPDEEALLAGLNACIKQMDELKKRRGPKSRSKFTVDTPQFAIAVQYVEGSIAWKEACARLKEINKTNGRTAQKDLAEMKPRAESTSRFLRRLRETARISD